MLLGPETAATNTVLVTKGTLPHIENKLQATRASFNEPQILIIQDGQQNYQISKVYPQYVFTDPEHLNLFIKTVRERELLGKFLPDKIYQQNHDRDPISRRKVVRLWVRNELQSDPEVTMTFENTSANEQKDWYLREFRYPAILSNKGRAVEITTLDMAGIKTTFLFADRDTESEPRCRSPRTSMPAG